MRGLVVVLVVLSSLVLLQKVDREVQEVSREVQVSISNPTPVEEILTIPPTLSVSQTPVECREPEYVETFLGEITMYTEGPESTGKSPSHPEYGITASGKKVQENHTVAMGRKYPFGTRIRIEGFEGEFVCEDRGGRIHERCVDIYISSSRISEAYEFGRQKRRVWVVEYGSGDE